MISKGKPEKYSYTIKCTLCKGQSEKRPTMQQVKDDFCIPQESSFLSPIDI